MREAIRADEANDLCVEMALHTRADAQYDARIAGRWSSGVIRGHQGSSGVIRCHQRSSAYEGRRAHRRPRAVGLHVRLDRTPARVSAGMQSRRVGEPHACVPDEAGNQTSSERGGRQSDVLRVRRQAIRRHQSRRATCVRAPEAFPMQSGVVRCHQRSSAYERPRPSRWGTLRAEKRWITCAGSGRRGERLQSPVCRSSG